MLRFLLGFSFLMAPVPGLSYPQTIIKNYQSCDVCHVDTKGGGLLNDYGRSMTEAFMATWVVDGEAREFVFAKSDIIDLGADFRYLSYTTDGGTESFAKVYEAEIAWIAGNMTLTGTVGKYGRHGQDITYRRTSLALDVFKGVSLKVGHFIPAYGLGINQHIRYIKRNLGLGQGSEMFTSEIYIRPKWAKFFISVSRPDLNIMGRTDGSYHVQRGDVPDLYFLRMSLTAFKKVEAGGSLKMIPEDPEQSIYGVFFRASAIKNSYLLGEADYKDDDILTYIRGGMFPVKGMDFYLGYETAGESSRVFGGLDWMIRPRLETQFVAEWDKLAEKYRLISMLHLWL